MAKFKNQSGITQRLYLPSVHSKVTGRRLDGEEVRSWDQDAGKTILAPDEIIEVTDPADIKLLKNLTRERHFKVARSPWELEGTEKILPGILIEVDDGQIPKR